MKKGVKVYRLPEFCVCGESSWRAIHHSKEDTLRPQLIRFGMVVVYFVCCAVARVKLCE